MKSHSRRWPPARVAPRSILEGFTPRHWPAADRDDEAHLDRSRAGHSGAGWHGGIGLLERSLDPRPRLRRSLLNIASAIGQIHAERPLARVLVRRAPHSARRLAFDG